MVNTFYKNHLEKLTAILTPLNSALLMAKLTVSAKQKQERLVKRGIKRVKWNNKDLNQYSFLKPEASK